MYKIKFTKTTKISTKMYVDTKYNKIKKKNIIGGRNYLKIRCFKIVLFLDTNNIMLMRMVKNNIESFYIKKPLIRFQNATDVLKNSLFYGTV